MTILLWVAAVVLVVVGLAGVILPALPGTVLIFAGLVLAAWGDDFTKVGTMPLVAIGLIGGSSYLVDFAAAALGARHLGASPRAMAGAAIGTIAGLFFGFVGVIFGPFVGAIIGELTVSRDAKQVGKAGLAAWLGFAIGTAVKVAMAFLMVGIFLAAWLFN